MSNAKTSLADVEISRRTLKSVHSEYNIPADKVFDSDDESESELSESEDEDGVDLKRLGRTRARTNSRMNQLKRQSYQRSLKPGSNIVSYGDCHIKVHANHFIPPQDLALLKIHKTISCTSVKVRHYAKRSAKYYRESR